MAMNMSKSINLQDLWNVLLANQTVPGSIGHLVAKKQLLGFVDEFNRTLVDADVWIFGSDGGAFTRVNGVDLPTCWMMATGGIIDNDAYINADGVLYNPMFHPLEYGYTTITWECRAQLVDITTVSSLLGLFFTPPQNYAEPVQDCAHFLMDPVVSGTFRARTFDAAEEETDTLVALDALFHRFRIVWTVASVLFYLDDVLVATHAAQVPDIRMMSGLLVRTEAAAARYLRVDYVRVGVS